MVHAKPNHTEIVNDDYQQFFVTIDGKKYRAQKNKKTGETEILNENIWLSHSFNDEPALTINNIAFWRHFGTIHRDNDKPAIVWSNGYKQEWFVNGKKHRWLKPAIIYKDNPLKLYYLNGTNITHEVEHFIENYPNDDLEIIFFEMSLMLKT